MNRLETADRIMDLAEAIRPGLKLITDLEKERIRLERVFIPELIKEYRALGSHVANAADGQGGLLIEASRNERSRIAAILSSARLRKWAEEHMKPLLERQWRRVVDSTMLMLRRHEVPVTLRSELARELLLMGGKRVGLLDIEDDTRRSLFHVLEEGREKGLNPRSIAKEIEDKVPAGRFIHAGPSYRAELLARTETVEAQRRSSLRVYADSEAIKEVEGFDGDQDAECAARNGSRFTLEEAESESEGTHPNCTLAWAPIV